MASKLFVTKSIDKLLDQADASKHTFKRTLGVGHLVLLGIGAIIGAGLFAVSYTHLTLPTNREV